MAGLPYSLLLSDNINSVRQVTIPLTLVHLYERVSLKFMSKI